MLGDLVPQLCFGFDGVDDIFIECLDSRVYFEDSHKVAEVWFSQGFLKHLFGWEHFHEGSCRAIDDIELAE